MSITIVQALPEGKWRQFVNQQPAGNIFHTPEMFQVFARARGHQPTLWAAVDNGEQVLALLLPVNITWLNGLLRHFTTRGVAYGSVLCTRSVEGQKALAVLLHTYKREVKGSLIFTELRNLSDLSDLQPILKSNGFAYQDHLNYLVDLDCSPEAVFQNIGPRTRKKIRRAIKQGEVIIEEANRCEQVMLCYKLLKKTYAAARVPLADWSLFKAAFDILYPRHMAKFLLARIGARYVAGSVELIYKDGIYGWYGGMDRTCGNYIPNELLLWHIFQWGAENGYKVYDFGGAGKPGEKYGVRDFKAKFGGELVCFGRNIYIHAPALMRLGQWTYSAFRKLL